MPYTKLQPYFPIDYTPKIDVTKFANLLNPPTTPAPTQIPALQPYPTPVNYPDFTYSPPAIQMKPTVQKAAIDPTLLMLGGVAVLALLVMTFKK